MAIINQVAELRSAIERLKSGDYVTPVSTKNRGRLTGAFSELELLRLSLIIKEWDADFQKQQLNTTVSGVTHDLKTPLAMIAGYAECLGDGMDDRDYVSLIHDKAMDMNDTVLKIIEVAKTDVGDVKKKQKLSDVRRLFSSILKRLSPVAAEKGVTVKVKRLPKKVFVYVNEDKIYSVMQNFFSNAVKHMEKGGVITVKFSVARGKLHVSVKDNGSGISEADLPRVFEKYYTEDKARTHGGSGLGLAIAKETIEEHGGEISVKSKEGKGAVFTFTLPCYGRRKLELVKEGEGKMACNKWTAFVLCLLLGFFGGHKFYEKNYARGVLYIFTGGLLIVGWLSDIIIYLMHPNPYYVTAPTKEKNKK